MVHLESKFMSKLDEYTPTLLALFQSKGGTMGLRLQGILLKVFFNQFQLIFFSGFFTDKTMLDVSQHFHILFVFFLVSKQS